MSGTLYDELHNAILGIVEEYQNLTDAECIEATEKMTDAAMEAIPDNLRSRMSSRP